MSRSAAPPGGARRTRPRVPKGARPVYLRDADGERLLSMTLALAAEVSVLSEELDSLREVLQRAGVLDPSLLHGFRPDEPVEARRAARRRALIRRMLRIVLEDLDGPAAELRREHYRELVRSLSG
ncbi:MAG: hypothetical protein MUF07_16580 [Steroidobacteraceae bacterium]|nr:hypothetical protein [Steroidobacteraceae bacterium]